MTKNNVLILASGGIALLAFMVAGVASFLYPDIPLIWQISLGVGVLGIAAYVFQERVFFKHVLGKRTTQYGLNSVFMCLVAFAILVVVNLIVVEHDVKKDFTKNKLHTLSEQSVKVMQGLKAPVKIIAFVQPQQQAEFQKIFDKYTYYSKEIKPEFVDTDKDPTAPRRYGVKAFGTVIVESDNRSTRIENLFGGEDPKIEEKITNAIISVLKGEKKKMCFLIGHGEMQISDSSPQGFSEMKDSLEGGRFRTEEITLLDKDKVPADCELIASLGPKSDFPEREIALLEEYLKKGGKLLVLLKPYSTGTLTPFLAKYGIDWKPGKSVFERNPFNQLAGGDPVTPMVSQYDPGHEVTRELRNQPSMFILPTPVEKAAKAPDGMRVDSLFSTSNRSFEAIFDKNKVTADERTARRGPISLGVAVVGKAAPAPTDPAKTAEELAKKAAGDKDDKKDTEFRLVVVGDTEFAGNGVRKFGLNADLFQNIVSWLAKEEDLISIRPKEAGAGEFEVTMVRARIVTVFSMFLLPLSLFIAGIFVWVLRRRR